MNIIDNLPKFIKRVILFFGVLLIYAVFCIPSILLFVPLVPKGTEYTQLIAGGLTLLTIAPPLWLSLIFDKWFQLRFGLKKDSITITIEF